MNLHILLLWIVISVISGIFAKLLPLDKKAKSGGNSTGIQSNNSTSSKPNVLTLTPDPVNEELLKKCKIKTYKSILHGKALISSCQFNRDEAEECCGCAGGFDALISLDDEYSTKIFVNSHRLKFRETYHAYTKQDGSGNFLTAQGRKIPRELMSKDTYSSQLKPGNCLYVVIEAEEGERVVRYATGSCDITRPFICMKFGQDDTFNVGCNVSQFYPSLESASERQTPSEEQIFDLTQQNRRLAKSSLHADIHGWSAPVSSPVRAFQLAVRTFEVYRKIVPVSVLPAGFMTKIMILFAEMNGYHTPVDKTDFITEDDFSRIDTLLSKCGEKLQEIPYVLNECKTQILGTLNDDNETTNYICPERPFFYNHFVSDPLFHVTQNVFQTVRNLCFPTFKESSIRMFHRWQLAINDCFTQVLEIRWKYQIEKNAFWNRMLGAHFDDKVRGTDAVAMAVFDKLQPWSSKYPRGPPPPLRIECGVD